LGRSQEILSGVGGEEPIGTSEKKKYHPVLKDILTSPLMLAAWDKAKKTGHGIRQQK
jgi:hypothetical protein